MSVFESHGLSCLFQITPGNVVGLYTDQLPLLSLAVTSIIGEPGCSHAYNNQIICVMLVLRLLLQKQLFNSILNPVISWLALIMFCCCLLQEKEEVHQG